MVFSNYDDVLLGAPAFEPYFAAADELGILVIIHPAVTPVDLPFVPRKNIPTFSGYLNDQRSTLLDLVTAGVLENHPDLTIVATHLGGGILALPEKDPLRLQQRHGGRHRPRHRHRRGRAAAHRNRLPLGNRRLHPARARSARRRNRTSDRLGQRLNAVRIRTESEAAILTVGGVQRGHQTRGHQNSHGPSGRENPRSVQKKKTFSPNERVVPPQQAAGAAHSGPASTPAVTQGSRGWPVSAARDRLDELVAGDQNRLPSGSRPENAWP